MKKRQYHEQFKTGWDTLRTSFWFVPSLMIAAAAILAPGAALFDLDGGG
jgi:uncharacterized membrane protein